jgi:phosphatidate cytidylyltransferase
MTGRFARRLIFGTLLVGLLALGLWFDAARAESGGRPIAAPLLVALFTLPAAHELLKILAAAGMPAPRRSVLVAAALLMLGKAHVEYHRLEPRDAWFLSLLVALVVLVSTVLVLERDVASGARRTAAAFLTLAVVALQSTMIDVAYDWGTSVLFALVLTSKAGDTGAYLVGKSMGRTKLIAHVSPKKTVEGAIGGFVASLLVGWWLIGRFGHGRWTTGEVLAVSAVVNLAGQVGGYLNSLCKRAAGVKDSGRILPEFGGALDIVDSLFLAMPAGWALLAALAL